MSEVQQPICPAEETLAEFADGVLRGGDGEAIEAHLDGCAGCAWVVGQLLTGGEPATAAARELRAAAPPSYRLHEVLGSGGMGTVYEAEDLRLGRRVALKLLREETVGRPGRGARFLREARITAFLEHPNIVPVLEVGELEDGAPYYTQRLVRGRTLAQAIAGCKDLRERLLLLPHFRDLCNAVAYAHGQGVLHRDLKPSNVLVGPFGETVVVDWGLARRRDAPPEPPEKAPLFALPDLTQDGQAIGTPGYMSPEQAAGRIDLVDARSDVFGLGAVLFELLVGRPPFVGKSDEEVLRKAAEGSSPAPDAAGVPRDLAAIAAKALSRERSLRYADAVEMKGDVEAFSEGRLVTAYDYNAAQIVARFAARHRAFTAGLLVALILGGGWLGNFVGRRAEQQRQLAADFVGSAYRYTIGLQWDRAATYYASARVAHETPAARWGLAFVGATGAEPLYKLRRHAAGVSATSFAPGAKVFATGSEDGSVSLVQTDTGRELARFEAHAPIAALGFSADGGTLFAAAGSALYLWDTARREPRGRIEPGGAIGAIALSVSGTRAVTAAGSEVRVFELAASREPIARLRAPGAVDALALLPSGEVVFAGASFAGVRRWDPSRPEAAAELLGTREVRARRLLTCRSPRVLVLDQGGGARVWTLENGQVAESLEMRAGMVCRDAALSADCGTAACLGEVGNARVWDVATGAMFATVAGSFRAVLSLALSADGDLLAVGSADRALRLSSVRRARVNIGHAGGGQHVTGLAWSPDGATLVSLDQRGLLAFWDPASGELRKTVEAHTGSARAIAFSPAGGRFATAGADGVRLWDTEGRALGSPTPVACSSLAFSPSGALLAAGTEAGALLLLPSGAGAPASLAAHRGELRALAFSPDGTRLATAGRDGALLLWDASTFKLVARLEGHGDLVSAVAFSADGALLVSGSGDRSVRVWSAAEGKPLRVLRSDSTGEIDHLLFAPRAPGSPAAGLLLSTSSPATLDLWDAASGAAVMQIGSWPTPWGGAAFSPDARRLALVRRDGVLTIRDLTGTERLRSPAAELEALMKLYKYRATANDLERDEEAMKPPAER